MNITQIIAQGESITLEFKSTIDNPAKIAKTLVAFANTRGGTLLIGVTDKGEICGIGSEYELMRYIEQASDMYCQPPLLISYETVSVDDQKVLVINIPESEEKPHAVRDPSGKDTVYIRVHDKSVPAGKRSFSHITAARGEADKALLQSPNVRALLKYLQAHEYITVKRYAKLINISERRAERLLIQLAANQMIIPIGREKDVVYSSLVPPA